MVTIDPIMLTIEVEINPNNMITSNSNNQPKDQKGIKLPSGQFIKASPLITKLRLETIKMYSQGYSILEIATIRRVTRNCIVSTLAYARGILEIYIRESICICGNGKGSTARSYKCICPDVVAVRKMSPLVFFRLFSDLTEWIKE